MSRWTIAVAASLLVGFVPLAGAQGQGKDKGQGQGKPQVEQPVQLPVYDKDKDKDRYKDQGASNHGQVVSECNHRANARNLKGQDRKEYVEWCESRGARYKYDDGRYGNERDCYRRADKKGLTGEKRRNFLDKCFDDVEVEHYGKIRVNKG